MGGIYIHVPFCGSKCLYCSFYSLPVNSGKIAGYAECVISEMRSRSDEVPCTIDTIYIGGGTPSKLPDDSLSAILNFIGSEFADRINPSAEITLEVNPEDVSDRRASEWVRMGVNRISMGVQSLNDTTLRKIGRRHSSDDAIEAYCIIRNYFSNVSLDLICGLPESQEEWKNSVDKTMDMFPEHISVYLLETDNDSALSRLLSVGKISLPAEEIVKEEFEYVVRQLKSCGYKRYEISNFALPGFESRHNSSYWKGKPYIGIGPAASSFDGVSKRRTNSPDLNSYINRCGNADFVSELLNVGQLRIEYLLTRLRTSSGINIPDFKERFGEEECGNLLSSADNFIKSGDLQLDGNFLKLTEKGSFIEDFILGKIV